MTSAKEAGVPQIDPGDYQDSRGEHAPADDASTISAIERKRLFTNLILPHLDDAFSLARWLTGNRVDRGCRTRRQPASVPGDRATQSWRSPHLAIKNRAQCLLPLATQDRPAAILTVEDLEGVEQLQSRAFEPDADTPENALIAKTEIKRLMAIIEKLPRPIGADSNHAGCAGSQLS